MKKKPTNATINVQGTEVTVIHQEGDDFISLTDMVRNFDGGPALIEQWLKNKDTVLFLGVWERLNNPCFKTPEFEGIKNEAGRNSFFLSARKWSDATGARGLIAKAGRYGGTFAHRDIAFEFGSWLSPEFKLYLIKEFQRLKEDENRRLSLAWNLNRTLAKINYRIHTDAIQTHLIPAEVTPKQAAFTYATEADLLNVALFGRTARDWRDANPGKDGNLRDHASLEQLLVLANLETMNAEFIHMELPQSDRIKRLNAMAIRQMQTLTARTAKQLGV
ncbi:MAG: KilA-N domain-containing protein [Limisphaerales bacterium]